MRWKFLWVGLLLLTGCQADRITKRWAQDNLRAGPVAVIPQVLELRYAENPAIAFSMFARVSKGVRTPVVFALSGAALSLFLIYAWKSRRRELRHLIPLALILAGAFGNLQDRLARGYVVDFVRVHWKESWSFAIFNVADSLICVGAALLIFSAYKSRPVRPDPEPSPPSP